MIAIIDYGMGNLRSVQKAIERVGGSAAITTDPAVLQQASGLILPGVGAFGDAMANLRDRSLVGPLLGQINDGKPLLGICLGMHLLFDESEEMGRHQGLGVLPGRVLRFPETELKVPHIGWNQLHLQRQSPLLAGVPDDSYAYFVHSYYVKPESMDMVIATTDYGIDYASMVATGNIYGAQFHPEKSQDIGLQIMRNFVRLVNDDDSSLGAPEGRDDHFAGD